MTKKNRNGLTVVDAKLPATKPTPNRWLALDRLADDADALAERDKALWLMERKLSDLETALRDGNETFALHIADAFDGDDGDLDESERKMLGQCQEALTVLDPEDYYGDDGELKAEHVTTRLALLLTSYTANPPADPEQYCSMLRAHVVAIEGLRYIALDAACRQLAEDENPFLPKPGQLVKPVRAQQELWDKRIIAINGIETFARYVAAKLERIKPQLDALAATRAANEAQAALARAHARRAAARRKAIAKQSATADAAKEFEAAMAELAECEADVAEKGQALNDAIRAKEEPPCHSSPS